jgi:hypothetical protein
MRFKILILLVICLTVFGCSEATRRPVQTANDFYNTLSNLNIRGLPTLDETKAINSFLSSELRSKFAGAKQEQEKFIEEAKSRGKILKAPWSGGNLFGSNYEGMSSFSLGLPQISNETVSIPVYLEYREGKNDKNPTQWIDILVLKQTDEGWKVYDLFFCAPWGFGTHGNLRSIISNL